MHPIRPVAVALVALLAGSLPAQSFPAGAVFLTSPILANGQGGTYPGIRRVDPHTGQTAPFAQFTSNATYAASTVYDPARDRIVVQGYFAGMPTAALWALDAAGAPTLLHPQGLVRLAPRGDGLIYGYLAGASNPTIQRIQFLDQGNQLQELLDPNGQPWSWTGGTPVSGDPIRAAIYAPSTNSLFLALQGDTSAPTCSGIPGTDVTILAVPLSGDGRRVRGATSCATFSVTTMPNVTETPIGWSHGPGGTLVLAVQPSSNGAMPRLLSVDPTTLQVTPFATVGPYYGDAGINCAAYCPTTNRVLLLDGSTDVFRAYAAGASGGGTVLASYGPPGVGSSLDAMCVAGPIGASNTLSADLGAVSVGSGGSQHLDFHPGAPFAGQVYFVLGSLSGYAPGFPIGGTHVPLQPDFYTNFTLSAPNSAWLVGTLGALDAAGTAQATIVVPPQLALPLAGFTLHHAALAIDNALVVSHASNPVPLLLGP